MEKTIIYKGCKTLFEKDAMDIDSYNALDKQVQEFAQLWRSKRKSLPVGVCAFSRTVKENKLYYHRAFPKLAIILSGDLEFYAHAMPELPENKKIKEVKNVRLETAVYKTNERDFLESIITNNLFEQVNYRVWRELGVMCCKETL